jgi:hypothetical protein
MVDTETCYSCDRPATTREHAPPKCFFPEEKDVGRDLRKNLISVPSCEDHNTARSRDDQYAMAFVVMQYQTTGVARDQFATKIIRSLKRDLTLVDQVFNEARQLTVNGQPSVVVSVDRARFDRVMASTFRALIYHESGEKLNSEVSVFSLGIQHQNFERDPNEAVLAFQIRSVLKEQPRLGANPEVFWYQFVHRPNEISAMRLHFYEGFSVYAVADSRARRAGLTRA